MALLPVQPQQPREKSCMTTRTVLAEGASVVACVDRKGELQVIPEGLLGSAEG